MAINEKSSSCDCVTGDGRPRREAQALRPSGREMVPQLQPTIYRPRQLAPVSLPVPCC